jgi:hypothetical protein
MKVGLFRASNGKDLGIFAGWIGGILLIGGGLWFFTQSARTGILQERVNQALADAGYSQYLEAAIPREELPKRSIPLGNWYTLRNSKSHALVFSMMADGILFPCVAVVSASGKVDEIIPLNSHSEQILQQLSQGIIQTYIRRIEMDVLGRLQEGNK